MRTARFSLESEYTRIKLIEKELAIRSIGFRDKDLEAAGIDVPLNVHEKNKAFI